MFSFAPLQPVKQHYNNITVYCLSTQCLLFVNTTPSSIGCSWFPYSHLIIYSKGWHWSTNSLFCLCTSHLPICNCHCQPLYSSSCNSYFTSLFPSNSYVLSCPFRTSYSC